MYWTSVCRVAYCSACAAVAKAAPCRGVGCARIVADEWYAFDERERGGQVVPAEAPIWPVSSIIHSLISRGACERCSRVMPIIPPVLELGMSMSDLCRSSTSE